MSLFNVADLEDSYRRFVYRVVERSEVWVLLSPEEVGAFVDSNHATDEDGEPKAVDLVFSAREFAERHCQADWATYTPASLSLEVYLEAVLPDLHGLGRLVLPDPNSQLAGLEVQPADLANALAAVRDGRTPDLRHE